MNPLKIIPNWLAARIAETKRKEALAGRATSGHLDSRERAAMFSKFKHRRKA